MTLQRVVVTGYGVTSPIGNTPEEFWNSLKEGNVGIGPITKFDSSDFMLLKFMIFHLINILSKKI